MLQIGNLELNNDIEAATYHESDTHIFPLVGNAKIEKLGNPKYTGRYSGLTTHNPTKWLSLDLHVLENHLLEVETCILDGTTSSRTPLPSSRGSARGGSAADVASNALTYLHAACSVSDVADIVVNSPIFTALAQCLRSRSATHAQKGKAAVVVGVIMRYATLVEPDVDMTAMVAALDHALRDLYRDGALPFPAVTPFQFCTMDVSN